jgi:hypothetical protein
VTGKYLMDKQGKQTEISREKLVDLLNGDLSREYEQLLRMLYIRK